ncbi:MAG: SMP-30/gluconolactonase/LRE family protein [Alphaproteobacteria bacterium]|nr:SMP-30/gluconolactonase/LRE family protein [Alphaproteobacteria bacterium]
MGAPKVLAAGGLSFPEGPRWRDGWLYFSDVHNFQVMRVAEDGRLEKVVKVPHKPSGLGWLPDGRMLVVSMEDRKLMRLEGGKLRLHADLSQIAIWHCNDMVVDGAGRAYVGNFGWDLWTDRDSRVPAALALVHPDGRIETAAEGLVFPNGSSVTPDGRSLIVAETFGARLTAFDIDEAGRLSNRRVWASMPQGAVPDGISLDAEGAIWVASPSSGEVIRLHEGGKVSARIKMETQAFACMLGGADGRTLFICTAPAGTPEIHFELQAGRIETVRVEVPHAGWP